MHWFVRIWGSSSSQEQQPWCKDPGTFLGCLCRNNLDFPIFVKKKSSRTHPVWVRVGRGSDLAHHVLNIFLTSIHIQLNIREQFHRGDNRFNMVAAFHGLLWSGFWARGIWSLRGCESQSAPPRWLPCVAQLYIFPLLERKHIVKNFSAVKSFQNWTDFHLPGNSLFAATGWPTLIDDIW